MGGAGQRWAIERCMEFFGLTAGDYAAIQGAAGLALLQGLWERNPDEFYNHPLQLLRQEWYHACPSNHYYAASGFWAALSPGDILLDFGCGTGEVARLPWIARQGEIDLYEPASETCRAYLRHKYRDNPLVHFGVAYELGVYDAVICTDVFEHVSDPLGVMQLLYDWLKPGGHALLKFSTAWPHPGHLQASIAQVPAWKGWVNDHMILQAIEGCVWATKPR